MAPISKYVHKIVWPNTQTGCINKKFFPGFYLYIINLKGRFSEVAMAGGGAQRLVLHINFSKKMGANSARAHNETVTH
jgi:hypothetical protein